MFVICCVCCCIANFTFRSSDGWDRTAQVGSVAALLIDERSRTTEGLLRVVSREWVFLGHRFATRLGMGHHRTEGLLEGRV
jgi:hypothetical protein